MSDQPAPIPEFEREPIKLWRHAGIDCAIYMGFSAPCGYVRLPETHPLRPIAEAADIMARVSERPDGLGIFQKWIDAQPEGTYGYEGLEDVLSAPGGLNWGPSKSGWVGFDTGHASDVWDLDVLRQWLPEGTPQRESFDMVAKLGGHPSQIIGRHRTGYEIEWTLDKLVRAVEHLADQVRALATVKK